MWYDYPDLPEQAKVQWLRHICCGHAFASFLFLSNLFLLAAM